MGKHPVLRPREVAAILGKLGFVKLDSAAHTNNIDTRTGGARQFLFTALATSHRSYCGKSQKI